MGSNMRKSTREMKIENWEVYNYYFERMINLARAQFRWQGLPETCSPWYLEKCMLNAGKAAIFKVKGTDIWLSTDFVYKTGGLDVYGLPTSISGVGANKGPIDTDEWEIMWDNQTHTSLLPQMRFYAKQLTMAHQIFNINLFQQTTPTIIPTNDNKLLTAINFAEQMSEFKPFIHTNASFNTQDITAFDLHVQFHGKELLEVLDKIWSNFLSMLGITPQTSKRERMNNDELVLNRQSDLISLNSRMEARIDMCNALNKRHGFNCSVNLSSNFIEESTFVPFMPLSDMTDASSRTTYDNVDKEGDEN